MMAFNPFTALTSKIFGGIAVLAIVLLGVQTVRYNGSQRALETKTAQLKASETRHRVTRGSVDRLEAEISKHNVRSLLRADALDRAKAQAAADKERLTRAARNTDEQIARLRASIGTSKIPVEQCPTPNLEELLQ